MCFYSFYFVSVYEEIRNNTHSVLKNIVYGNFVYGLGLVASVVAALASFGQKVKFVLFLVSGVLTIE